MWHPPRDIFPSILGYTWQNSETVGQRTLAENAIAKYELIRTRPTDR